jgi:hypothetical protein
MKSHSISVVVDGRTISVSPDPLVMTSDDELSWKCSGPQRITVEFDGAGPFTSRRLGHDAATNAQRPSQRGRFKYTVSLESDPSVNLDPDVIVGDPPTSPHP